LEANKFFNRPKNGQSIDKWAKDKQHKKLRSAVNALRFRSLEPHALKSMSAITAHVENPIPPKPDREPEELVIASDGVMYEQTFDQPGARKLLGELCGNHDGDSRVFSTHYLNNPCTNKFADGIDAIAQKWTDWYPVVRPFQHNGVVAFAYHRAWEMFKEDLGNVNNV
jgi:hypothetical protein